MKIVKLDSNKLLLIIILFILFRPEFFKYTNLDMFFDIARVLIFILISLKYILSKKVSNLFFYTIFIWGIFNLFCFINDTWTFNVFINFCLNIAVVMLVELYRNKQRTLDDSLEYILYIFAIFNILTILLGYEPEKQFLGFDNDIGMRVIPLIGSYIYLKYYLYNKLTRSCIFVLCLYALNFILTWSVTPFLTLVLFYLAIKFKDCKNYLSSRKIIFISIFVFFCLYYLKVQNLFSFILVNLLHKDLTLSYRTYIWESVIGAIKYHPIVGFGNIMNSTIYYELAYFKYYASIAPHNIFLYFLASGGVIGLSLFVKYILYCFKDIDKNKKSVLCKIAIYTLFAYMFCGITSSYYAIEYLLFFLATVKTFYRKEY